jgi:hypothetical protein
VTAVGAFSNEIGSTSVVVCLETVCQIPPPNPRKCRTLIRARGDAPEKTGMPGWGTWIRTKINGVKVRCSTVELSPDFSGDRDRKNTDGLLQNLVVSPNP